MCVFLCVPVNICCEVHVCMCTSGAQKTTSGRQVLFHRHRPPFLGIAFLNDLELTHRVSRLLGWLARVRLRSNCFCLPRIGLQLYTTMCVLSLFLSPSPPLPFLHSGSKWSLASRQALHIPSTYFKSSFHFVCILGSGSFFVIMVCAWQHCMYLAAL